MPARPFVLFEANYQQLREYRPAVAVLPWGATEAHNYHLPHGTDVIEACAVAERAAALAHDSGARVVVLPAIPFGNNAQQLDQVATISIRTATALAILEDVARSLAAQGIDRLVVVNAHGGNDFKPLIRDVRAETGVLIVLANFYQMAPAELKSIFDEPGDHAGEMETSLLLHLCPEWVELKQAGEGRMVPFTIEALRGAPGVWTPRPWSASHPDTGCGDPTRATAEKGSRYLEAVSRELAKVLIGLAVATKGQSPYL
jgi:creatinine amidohydrolase